MITGNKKVAISSYLLIDHVGEGFETVRPAVNSVNRSIERLLGVPWGYVDDHSIPFIEVQDLEGNVLRTINALDCSEIEFMKMED